MAYLMLVVIVLAIVLGFPVAFSLASIPMIFGLLTKGTRILPLIMVQSFGMLQEYSFVAAPLFIFMGALLEQSGIADKLYEAFYHLLGRLPGGLALATIAMATIFGACTGIVGAGVITIGLLALPSMLSRGYDKRLPAGSIMVGGGLGVTIPPSIMLILYGCAAGVSISKLFMASTVPGVILGLMYMVYVYILAKVKPEVAPPISDEERITGLPLLKLVLKSLVPPIFLILAVMGSIFFGIVSPSEAGAMGCLGALILVALAGNLNFKVIKDSITSTMRINTAVLLICLAGKIFTSVFVQLRGNVAMQRLLLSFDFGPTGTILVMLLLVYLLGMVMDWIALIFILVPIFVPIISNLGIDRLFFAILFCLTLQISNITPPFAYSVFYLKTITPPDVTVGDLYQACIPFALVSLLCPLMCMLFPKLILWLPSLMK